MLGNDIVDLRHQDSSGILYKTAFINRVYTGTEQEIILQSEIPEKAYWDIWALKESAYKALKAEVPGVIFAWKEFAVSKMDSYEPINILKDIKISGCITDSRNTEDLKKEYFRIGYKNFSLNGMILDNETKDRSHAIAVYINKIDTPKYKEIILFENKSEFITPNESVLARGGLLHCILKNRNMSAESIEKDQNGIPYLVVRNIEKSRAEIRVPMSLSHHGSWISGAAFF